MFPIIVTLLPDVVGELLARTELNNGKENE